MVSKFLKKFGQDFEVEEFAEQTSQLLQGADVTRCGVGAFGACHTMPTVFSSGWNLLKLRGWTVLEHFEVLILPDRTPYGPMYIARLRRRS